jgi:hypothetical protein
MGQHKFNFANAGKPETLDTVIAKRVSFAAVALYDSAEEQAELVG